MTGDQRAVSRPRDRGAEHDLHVFCSRAWLGPGEMARDVLLTVRAGRFTAVVPGSAPTAGSARLHGLVLPGFANAHSHAFHRALRGRSQRGSGSFWTWREAMYELAASLDPDRYRALATAVFAEMACAGFSTVGEFHYLHHDVGGQPYGEPNLMADAVIDAARAAGVRITLLDTCYLAGGLDQPLSPVQRRFADADADAWSVRVDELATRHVGAQDVIVGAAVHSVRAVPADQIPVVARWAGDRDAPVHAHVSEQPLENAACLEAYGVTPTRLLAECGLLGPRTTAVHATHVDDVDLRLLGEAQSFACLCPTTERDLADGIGPAGALARGGARLTIGTDSNAMIDAFEEARAIELNLRLETGVRGCLTTEQLLTAATAAGHESLGYPDAGRIAVGARADLVAVDTSSVRCAGGGDVDVLERVLFAASPCDITDVLVDGAWVVRERSHRLGRVGPKLAAALAALEVSP